MKMRFTMPNAIDALLWTVFMSLASVAFVIIVRNAPFVRGWVAAAKRPWSCNICMPLYVCAALTGVVFYVSRDLSAVIYYLPTYTLTHFILEYMSKAPSEPFIPTDLLDLDDDGEPDVAMKETPHVDRSH